MSRLEDEAGNAGVLDDVTPAWIGDIVGGAQHGRRWVSITVRPVPDALPLPGTTIGAGHATWPARLHLRQTRLPLATTNRGTVCVLCKREEEKLVSLGFERSCNKFYRNFGGKSNYHIDFKRNNF